MMNDGSELKIDRLQQTQQIKTFSRMIVAKGISIESYAETLFGAPQARARCAMTDAGREVVMRNDVLRRYSRSTPRWRSERASLPQYVNHDHEKLEHQPAQLQYRDCRG
jgi:hypothetical protein